MAGNNLPSPPLLSPAGYWRYLLLFSTSVFFCPSYYYLLMSPWSVWMAANERRTKPDPFSDEFIPILTKCIAHISHYQQWRTFSRRCTFLYRERKCLAYFGQLWLFCHKFTRFWCPFYRPRLVFAKNWQHCVSQDPKHPKTVHKYRKLTTLYCLNLPPLRFSKWF